MQNTPKTAGAKAPVIALDDGQLREHVSGLVRQSVEDTLNSLLDAEADELCNARKYEHTEHRISTRAGHYTRKFHTKAGIVELKMPKLRDNRSQHCLPIQPHSAASPVLLVFCLSSAASGSPFQLPPLRNPAPETFKLLICFSAKGIICSQFRIVVPIMVAVWSEPPANLSQDVPDLFSGMASAPQTHSDHGIDGRSVVGLIPGYSKY